MVYPLIIQLHDHWTQEKYLMSNHSDIPTENTDLTATGEILTQNFPTVRCALYFQAAYLSMLSMWYKSTIIISVVVCMLLTF